MKRETKNGYVELRADDGMILTSADNDDRVFVHGCATPHPDLWEEWSEEEAETWRNTHQTKEIEPLDMAVL